MLTKHLAVFVVLLAVVRAAAADEAVVPVPSPSPVQVTTEPTQQMSPNSSTSPSVASLPAEANAPQQILVRIQLVEINMTKLRKMGVDFSTLHNEF